MQFPCPIYQTRVFNTDIALSVERENLIQMVDRNHFDYSLVQYAIGKGLQLQQGCKVNELIPSEDQVTLHTDAAQKQRGQIPS